MVFQNLFFLFFFVTMSQQKKQHTKLYKYKSFQGGALLPLYNVTKRPFSLHGSEFLAYFTKILIFYVFLYVIGQLLLLLGLVCPTQQLVAVGELEHFVECLVLLGQELRPLFRLHPFGVFFQFQLLLIFVFLTLGSYVLEGGQLGVL